MTILNPSQLASLAHEAWMMAIPQRDRTVTLLRAYVDTYAGVYFGSPVTWPPDVRAHVDAAHVLALQLAKPWHFPKIGA